jgi:predicted nucleic acid-binding protein
VNVVDSSGWLEFFAGGPNADFFADALGATDDLAVPTITVFEVFKRVAQQRGEDEALQAVALMQQGSVIDLSIHLALEAARTSSSLGIPMADSIILATARSLDATLWTQDADFAAVEGVRYVEKVRLG